MLAEMLPITEDRSGKLSAAVVGAEIVRVPTTVARLGKYRLDDTVIVSAPPT